MKRSCMVWRRDSVVVGSVLTCCCCSARENILCTPHVMPPPNATSVAVEVSRNLSSCWTVTPTISNTSCWYSGSECATRC
jgi:hypothetical protein